MFIQILKGNFKGAHFAGDWFLRTRHLMPNDGPSLAGNFAAIKKTADIFKAAVRLEVYLVLLEASGPRALVINAFYLEPAYEL